MAMDLGGQPDKSGFAAPTMNVTPLVDVVLVLLIIFMVVTPLLAKQFWVNLPNKVEKEEPAQIDALRRVGADQQARHLVAGIDVVVDRIRRAEEK